MFLIIRTIQTHYGMCEAGAGYRKDRETTLAELRHVQFCLELSGLKI